MEITIKKSTMIRPATHTPSHILWCSPMDQLMMTRWKHVSIVILYKSSGSINFFLPQALKEALSNVLVPFYPAAGRLGRDESGRIEIICNSQGVLFVEAEASAVLDDLNDFALSTKLHPYVDYSGDLSSYPLLLIQVTRFRCGGVALGYRVHHVLTDAASISLFLTNWCAMARGSRFNGTISPFIDRTIIKSLMPPAPTFHHVEYDPPPSMRRMPVSTTESTSSSVFKITGDQVTRIKAECNRTGKYKYNTFCILAAHIWRCATKARGLPNDQETMLTIPIDGRSKLKHPPLPPGYFGNCIFEAAAIARAGDLLSEPFADTVERIHKAINQQDEAYLKSAIACLDKLVTNPMPPVHEATPYSCPNLSINKLSRFPVHEMDFGWGTPILMGQPPAGVAMIYMLPPSSTDHDDGGLTLISGLETPHMKIFHELVCKNSPSKL